MTPPPPLELTYVVHPPKWSIRHLIRQARTTFFFTIAGRNYWCNVSARGSTCSLPDLQEFREYYFVTWNIQDKERSQRAFPSAMYGLFRKKQWSTWYLHACTVIFHLAYQGWNLNYGTNKSVGLDSEKICLEYAYSVTSFYKECQSKCVVSLFHIGYKPCQYYIFCCGLIYC